MSFAEKVAQKSSTPIHYILTYDATAQPCYFFLMCPLAQLNALEEARIKGGMLDLTQYGKIVASGFGHEPDAYTLQWLKEVYSYEIPEDA